MPFADVNGQQLAYDDTGGDGQVVVLSHGFLMDRTMFEHQVAALAPAYRVVTWDERGFGDTVHDGEEFTYWDSARDLLGLLDHLGVERAVLGGMSQGGFISMRAALLEPGRVRGLILLDSGSDNDDEATLAGYRMLADTVINHGWPDEVAQLVANLIIADPELNEVWIAKRRARDNTTFGPPASCLFDRDDITDRLGEITAPALVVHGTADTSISPERAEKMIAGLANVAKVVWVEGGPHAANMTHPEPVNAAITDYLTGLAD
jgi:pimeloyl-ACP methyl ester carboxylesterase